MATSFSLRHPVSAGDVVQLLLRIAGAGLLGAMAGIHLYLWTSGGYRDIATIGPLFLLNGIVAGLLAVAVLGSPRRFLAIVAVLSALFTAGTLGALLLSLTTGLFGFNEVVGAPLVPATLGVESAGVLVLGVLAVVAALATTRTSLIPRRR
jgi:hypothetical protein